MNAEGNRAMSARDRDRAYTRAKNEGSMAKRIGEPRDSNPYWRDKGSDHIATLGGVWYMGWTRTIEETKEPA
jgi:hypothetical protein